MITNVCVETTPDTIGAKASFYVKPSDVKGQVLLQIEKGGNYLTVTLSIAEAEELVSALRSVAVANQ